MTYRLEASLNLKHTNNAVLFKNELINIAYKCGCESCWTDVEISGYGRVIKRNNVVIIFNFPENIKNIMKFLNYVKTNRNIYIESIGFDNIKYTLIYASKLYLNMLDKEFVKDYRKNRNASIINNLDYQKIINAI
jgi:hypothetical protein